MTRSETAPFDPGLQPERTALAWRRTALAFALGPVVAARLLAPQLGALAAAGAVLGLALGVLIAGAAATRYRTAHRALTDAEGSGLLPGGGLMLLTAVVPFLGGAVALAVLIGRL